MPQTAFANASFDIANDTVCDRRALRFGETLMPFRQIAAGLRVRRVSPYAITSMPFRQNNAARCHSETVCLRPVNLWFAHRKPMVCDP